MADTNKQPKTHKRIYKLTIEVNEDIARENYPNYRSLGTPDELADFIVAGLNDMLQDTIERYGYTAILERED